MEPERKPSEKPEPQLKPTEPEMSKGQANDPAARTPETEPAKQKRVDDL